MGEAVKDEAAAKGKRAERSAGAELQMVAGASTVVLGWHTLTRAAATLATAIGCSFAESTHDNSGATPAISCASK